MNKEGKWYRKPENLYLSIALCFGFCFLWLTPPLQVPDEEQHFYRAFQVAEGQFLPLVHEGRTGGWIPVNLLEIHSSLEYLKGKPENKMSVHQISDLMKIPPNSNERRFISLRSSVYSPVSYLPQSIAIFLGNLLHASPLFLLYMGRVINLFFFLVFGYATIRMVPFFK